MKAKWLSPNNHIHNVHTDHGNHFPTDPTGKKWFKSHRCMYSTVSDCVYAMHALCMQIPTKASEKITALLTNAYRCKDITRLSALHQTSLEFFHSVPIDFAPKSVALSHLGMKCRYNTIILVIFVYTNIGCN